MPALSWVTDIHFNFISAVEQLDFCQKIQQENSSGVLVGGDIGEALSICNYLTMMAEIISKPIYFVLGNHDFYHGSIGRVRENVRKLVCRYPHLHFLPDKNPIELSSVTVLLGCTAWADGRNGDFFLSPVRLNDFTLISELQELEPVLLYNRLNMLGDDDAVLLDGVLPGVMQKYREVIILTHVPPFDKACWHEGNVANSDYLPHFSNSGVGQVIVKVLDNHSNCSIRLFCGHTHSPGVVQIRPNLEVITGGAKYYQPELQTPVEFR